MIDRSTVNARQLMQEDATKSNQVWMQRQQSGNLKTEVEIIRTPTKRMQYLKHMMYGYNVKRAVIYTLMHTLACMTITRR